MDWHHPDGARCATDEAARRRFVDYMHGLIRELLTNYGKIDVLWYDVDWPLDRRGVGIGKDERDGVPAAAGYHRQQSQRAARRLSRRPSSASSAEDGRAWESCMTMNGQLGISEGRRRLENAQDHRPQSDHLRARRRQLSAEHRPQRGWLDPQGIGADSDGGRQVDGRSRRHDL